MGSRRVSVNSLERREIGGIVSGPHQDIRHSIVPGSSIQNVIVGIKSYNRNSLVIPVQQIFVNPIRGHHLPSQAYRCECSAGISAGAQSLLGIYGGTTKTTRRRIGNLRGRHRYIYILQEQRNLCQRLQHVLDEVLDWASRWSLRINGSKCVAVRFTNRRPAPPENIYVGNSGSAGACRYSTLA